MTFFVCAAALFGWCLGANVLDASLGKFVVASQRLIAGGDVLASSRFYDVIEARRLQSKTLIHTNIERIDVSLFEFASQCAWSTPPRTYDWLVFAANEFYFSNEGAARKLLLLCAKWTHFGVLLWSRTSFNESRVCEGTEFVFVDDQSALVGHAAHVYNLKRLIGSQDDLGVRRADEPIYPFTHVSDTPINWSDLIVLGGAEFRAHVPTALQRALQYGDIVVTINSDKVEQRDAIRRTWAVPAAVSHLAIVVCFVVASPDRAIVDEAARTGDLVIVEALEGYNKSWSVLPLKGLGSRQVILNYAVRASWFFRCDDDTYVNAANLFALLNRPSVPDFATHVIYIGCAFDSTPYRNATGLKEKWNASPALYKPHRYPRYMSGGSGYALSRRAAICVADAMRHREWQYFDREDVLMRLTLASFCSPLVVESYCDLFKTQFVEHPASAVISIHYAQPPDRMSLLHNYTQSAPLSNETEKQ